MLLRLSGKRAAKRLRQEVQAHIDEYYKLDYEDIVGGMPTRFKYKEVRTSIHRYIRVGKGHVLFIWDLCFALVVVCPW